MLYNHNILSKEQIIMRVNNINKNELSFNAKIKGTDFHNKKLMTVVLKQQPFDKCNEVFSVSTSQHAYNGYTCKYMKKAFIAIRKLYHNDIGVSQSKQPEIKGIPIAVPLDEDRDLCIIECIMKYLSENYDTIPMQAYDIICKKLGTKPLHEIMSTRTRIEQYAKDTCQNSRNFLIDNRRA